MGEGIGRVNGYTLFIKDTVIGDEVEAKIMKAKKSYGYARLLKILTPSVEGFRHTVRLPENAADVRSRKWIIRASLPIRKGK